MKCYICNRPRMSKDCPAVIPKAKSIKERLNYIKMKTPSHQKRKLKAEGPTNGGADICNMCDKELVGSLF